METCKKDGVPVPAVYNTSPQFCASLDEYILRSGASAAASQVRTADGRDAEDIEVATHAVMKVGNNAGDRFRRS